jgi:hypothetical protein
MISNCDVAAGGRLHRVAGVREDHSHDGPDDWLIVDDENTPHTRVSRRA